MDNHDAPSGSAGRARSGDSLLSGRDVRFDSTFLTIVREHGALLERIDNSRN